jgi:hypothetical protein
MSFTIKFLPAVPAMEAGISDHVWSLEGMSALLPEMASATKRSDKGLILKALENARSF